MEKYHRDIRLCKKISGEPIWHDPLYEKVSYNPLYDFWGLDLNCPPKAFMNFARPIQVSIRQWDPVADGWETIYIDEYDSYYRPSEFYDHYYSLSEIENLKNKHKFIESWLIYLKFLAFTMEKIDPCIYNPQIFILENMLNNNKSYMDSLHEYLDFYNYRIVKNIPQQEKFSSLTIYNNKSNKYFDETWNTVDYFHLLLPKARTYFVNPEKLTCTCLCFKRSKLCLHLLEFIIKRVLYSLCENTQLVTDLTPNVLKYCFY